MRMKSSRKKLLDILDPLQLLLLFAHHAQGARTSTVTDQRRPHAKATKQSQ